MFGKKCAYCRSTIEKGTGVKREVKKPGYVGTFQKDFCCEEHAGQYVSETATQKKGGCCC